MQLYQLFLRGRVTVSGSGKSASVSLHRLIRNCQKQRIRQIFWKRRKSCIQDSIAHMTFPVVLDLRVEITLPAPSRLTREPILLWEMPPACPLQTRHMFRLVVERVLRPVDLGPRPRAPLNMAPECLLPMSLTSHQTSMAALDQGLLPLDTVGVLEDRCLPLLSSLVQTTAKPLLQTMPQSIFRLLQKMMMMMCSALVLTSDNRDPLEVLEILTCRTAPLPMRMKSQSTTIR